MKPVIETERLVLCEFAKTDARLVFQLNSDPEVTRYTHDRLRTLTGAQGVLNDSILPQYRKYGYGRWAVYLKADHSFIGWCGLKYRPERNETDLGYRFLRACWGKGYGIEAARACIEYGFQLGIPVITARAEPENISSVKLLEKVGFQKIGVDEVDGFEVVVFRILHLPGAPGRCTWKVQGV